MAGLHIQSANQTIEKYVHLSHTPLWVHVCVNVCVFWHVHVFVKVGQLNDYDCSGGRDCDDVHVYWG